MSSKWHGEIDVGDCRSILTRYIDQSHHHDNEVFYAHAKMKKDIVINYKRQKEKDFSGSIIIWKDSGIDILNTNKWNDFMTKAEVAPFGRGKATLIDKTVRNARTFMSENFTTNLSEILVDSDIKAALEDTFQPKIKIVPYRINIYGKRCFFKNHKDTPKSQKNIATLVVCLPTKFKGGELKINSRKYDLKPKDNSSITLIAFSGDIDHEVLPIISGNRITITYDIFAPDDDHYIKELKHNIYDYKDLEILSLPTSNYISSNFTKYFDLTIDYWEKNRLYNGKVVDCIAYGCNRLYIQDENEPCNTSNIKLRGHDKMIYDLFIKRGFDVEIKFYSIYNNSSGGSSLGYTGEDWIHEIKDNIQGEVHNKQKKAYYDVGDIYGEHEINYNIVWLNCLKHTNEVDELGNGGGTHYYYVNLTLLVHLPKTLLKDTQITNYNGIWEYQIRRDRSDYNIKNNKWLKPKNPTDFVSIKNPTLFCIGPYSNLQCVYYIHPQLADILGLPNDIKFMEQEIIARFSIVFQNIYNQSLDIQRNIFSLESENYYYSFDFGSVCYYTYSDTTPIPTYTIEKMFNIHIPTTVIPQCVIFELLKNYYKKTPYE
jgi:hypothetical protein